MTKQHHSRSASRRSVLKAGTASAVSILFGRVAAAKTPIDATRSFIMPKAFVFTELPISVPDSAKAVAHLVSSVRQHHGLLTYTWLSEIEGRSLSGIGAFDSLKSAQDFVHRVFPREAKRLGVTQRTQIFDATVVQAASQDIGSPHFGGQLPGDAQAFVYTEVQVDLPFTNAPWRQRNPRLRQQPGLLAKTWFSGLYTHTIGGLDVFDSLEHAYQFAVEDFPKTAMRLNGAFSTRIFDMHGLEMANLQTGSPYRSHQTQAKPDTDR